MMEPSLGGSGAATLPAGEKYLLGDDDDDFDLQLVGDDDSATDKLLTGEE
jgi:hypothetical protein